MLHMVSQKFLKEVSHLAEATCLKVWEEQKLVPAQQKIAKFVQEMQAQIEIAPNGIPIAYIDPTIVAEVAAYADTLDDIPQDKYNEAIVPIETEDGLAVVDGIPLWERLDGEKLDYYKLFKEYRDMKYEAVKVKNREFISITNRSIAKLSENLNVSGKLLNILSKIYHWMIRVKAFDVYKEREIAGRKFRQAEELENIHAAYSNQILEEAVKYLSDNIKQLNPKVAVQMVELGMKYGRISAGLLGDKPGTQAGAAHQTNIAIQQSNTHNEADQMINVDTGSGVDANMSRNKSQSAVERQLSDDMKDPNTMVRILNVLNKSGAFAQAVSTDKTVDDNTIDEGDDIELDPDDVKVEEVTDDDKNK